MPRRPRIHPLLAPLAAGAAGLAACAVLAVRDPNQQGSYGFCPFKAATGLDCPGCGVLRGVHALTQGDVAQAVGLNALLIVLVPAAIWGWFRWVRAAAQGRTFPGLALTRPATIAVIVAVTVFWVARNLPFAPFSALGT